MPDIKEILTAIGEAIIQHAIYILETKGRYPLDRRTSKLLQSMRVEIRQGRNSRGQFEGFTPNARLELYALEYWKWVDSGRMPFTRKVPVAELLKWIKQKKLRGRARKGKGRGRFITDNQLAYMIQNSIYKKGIQGRHFVQPAFAEGQRLVELYLDHHLLDDMTYELDRLFKDTPK